MTTATDYNGWKNRETWALDMHLSNDEGLYLMVSEWAADAVAEAHNQMDAMTEGERKRRAIRLLGERIQEQVEEWAYDVQEAADEHRSGGNVSSEIVSLIFDVGSLWRVGWEDVAEGYIAAELEDT